ncbi:hypothetical protein CJU94_26505 [Paraburkholderia aromaticivorans]|uniref:Uncharacterized protein n=1 Tax=Paraburkholderia aromaticivorans TaxID=2026199 RepID=A0A248VRP6_9BURK|nr:hypothetical protein CJU94_26505 [Paraburkholderia aromaticivorans]
MRKRKFAGKMVEGPSLQELLNRLEAALVSMPERRSVCKALADLSRTLGSAGEKAPRRAIRSTRARGRREAIVESLPLFS